MDKKNNNQQKEEKDMSVAALVEEQMSLKDKLNKISTKASFLKSKNGMIVLDPENPQHREWYEDDSYERK